MSIKRYNTLQENEPLGSVRPGDFRFRGCVEHPEGWLVTYSDHMAHLAQLTAQPDGVTVRRIIEWAVARARNRPDTNASIIADEGLDRIYGQALASPAPVCVCGHSKADHAEKHGWECSEECACLKYTPAPAPDAKGSAAHRFVDKDGEPLPEVNAPAPAYDPKPDWRCKACEETGMRHCSEPERCGNMKPPAPACKTCGSAKVDENGRLLHWATCPEGSKPACKTCGDTKVVTKWKQRDKGTLRTSLDATIGPCPDCAKES